MLWNKPIQTGCRNQLIPPAPFSWKKEKGEQKKAARAHNANLMEESGKSPSLPSKRGM